MLQSTLDSWLIKKIVSSSSKRKTVSLPKKILSSSKRKSVVLPFKDLSTLIPEKKSLKLKENLFKLLTAEELIILEDTYVKKFNVKRKLNLPMKVKINLFSLITVDDYFMLEKRYQRLSNASSIKPFY